MACVTEKKLLQLQKKFKTDAAIGETLGVTRQAVHQLRKKYGISSRTSEIPARNKKIVKLYEDGVAVAELIRMFALSLSQLYRILQGVKKRVRKRREERKQKRVSEKPAAKKTSKKRSGRR